VGIAEEIEQEFGKDYFQPPPGEYKDGFNIKSVIGGLFLAFIMMPGAIYLSLVAGAEGSMHTAGQWVTIILFTEVARRCFTRLTQQEIIILHLVSGGLVVAGGPFFRLIWHQYLIQSSEAEAFGIIEELSQNPWIAPPPGSEGLAVRSFLLPDWMPAVIVVVLTLLLNRVSHFTIGYALFRVTSDVERLPFPMAPITAQGVTALAESYETGESWRWQIFSTGAAMGMIFGLIYIVFPAVTGALANRALQLLPIPWIDLTPAIENFLPSALLGISTNIGELLVGFVLPFPLVLGQTIASLCTHLIANPILYATGVLTQWQPGMGTIATSMVNSLDLWMSFEIGTRILIAALGIYIAISALIKSKKEGKYKKSSLLNKVEGRGDYPLWLAVFIWFGATMGIIILCHVLVPNFPIWMFIFYGLVWSPFISYITARMVGLTGKGVEFPYIKEGSFLISTRYCGYTGVSIWFAPIPLHDDGGMAEYFKQMELTKTKFTSIIKAQLFIFPVLIATSILFCSFLWKINPIPSAAYPYAAKMWPLRAYYACLWATSTQTGNSLILQAIKLKYVSLGFSFGLIFNFLCLGFHLPRMFFYGFITGIGTWPHNVLLTFTGALISRYYFIKRFGRETWKKYATVLCAGFFCGMGLAGMISVGITLVSKSVVQMAY